MSAARGLRFDGARGRHPVLAALPVVTAVIVADQVTKAIAAQHGLVARNPAFALGVVRGPAALLVAGSLAVLLAFLGIVVPRARAVGVPSFAPALIAGGIIANTLDRARLGAARDFIATPWAIVNLADVAVATGILALVASALWHAGTARPASRWP
jgi:lipoprotein signal peptidase